MLFDPEGGWRFASAEEITTRYRAIGVAVTEVPRVPSLPVRHPVRIVGYMRRFVNGRQVVLLLLASAVAQLVGLMAPYLSGRVVDGTGLATFEPLSLAFLGFVAASLFSLALAALQLEIQARLSRRLHATMTADLTRRIFGKGVGWLAGQVPDRLAGKLATVSELQRIVIGAVANVAVRCVVGMAALVIVASIAWPLAVAALTMMIAKLAVEYAAQGRVASSREAAFQRAVNYRSALGDALRAAPTVVQYGASEAQCARLGAVHAESLEAHLRGDRWRRVQEHGVQLADAAERALFLLLGAALLHAGALTAGGYVALALYREAMVQGMASIKDLLMDLRDLRAVASRIEGLLKHETGALPASRRLADGTIVLSSVEFRYGRGDAPVLADLNLEIASGESVAIVGPSGAGKSTLAALLAGVISPQLGTITIGGVPLLPGDPHGVLGSVGSALQNAPLFAGTIRDNIDAYRGLPESAVEAAAKAAEIHDFIVAQPMGYGTLVGDQALAVSGGQRQRILIARALAGQCRVLIMDEATSALDPETERRIARTIAKLDMTRIIIAHREETIRHCDRIVRLEPASATAGGASRAA